MRVFNILLLASAVLFSSCGSGDGHSNNDPSAADTTGEITSVREIQTDSGKLVLTHHGNDPIEDAILMDGSGKIIARGKFLNNAPAGAWLRYDSDGNVISAVHYSDGQPKYILDQNDFKTERVSMPEMGISFVMPLQWDTVSPFNPKTFVSYEKNISEPGLIMKPNINIAKGTLEPGQTLEQLAADQLNMLHQTVGRVELVDESYLMIDSCRTFQRYGMYYTENNKVGFLDAIVVSGNNLYVISCAAQNREQGEFLKYQAVFENLVKSIEVNP